MELSLSLVNKGKMHFAKGCPITCIEEKKLKIVCLYMIGRWMNEKCICKVNSPFAFSY